MKKTSNKNKLILTIGLLSIGQPLFCGPFEDLWNDPNFVHEFAGVRTFAKEFRNQIRQSYGRAPRIGTLPGDRGGTLRISRQWLKEEFEKLNEFAEAGNSEHEGALRQMRSTMLKLELISLRHTGILKFVNDHPLLTAAVIAGAVVFCYSLIVNRRGIKPKPAGLLARLFSA